MSAKQTLPVVIQRVHALAKIPAKATANAVGWDVHCVENGLVLPFSTRVLRTGLAFILPPSLWMEVRSRSGLGFLQNLDTFHGVIDADFRGELKVRMTNFSRVAKSIQAGDRIAQLVFHNVCPVSFSEGIVNDDGVHPGFGSTGR